MGLKNYLTLRPSIHILIFLFIVLHHEYKCQPDEDDGEWPFHNFLILYIFIFTIKIWLVWPQRQKWKEMKVVQLMLTLNSRNQVCNNFGNSFSLDNMVINIAIEEMRKPNIDVYVVQRLMIFITCLWNLSNADKFKDDLDELSKVRKIIF